MESVEAHGDRDESRVKFENDVFHCANRFNRVAHHSCNEYVSNWMFPNLENELKARE